MLSEKVSKEVLLKYQTDSGAFPASPNFEHYRYCWLRDGSFIAYALTLAGEETAAQRFFQWVNEVILEHQEKVFAVITLANQGKEIHPDAMLHTRYTLEGREGSEPWGNFQLDGYGTYLWALAEFAKRYPENEVLLESEMPVSITAEYLIRFWHTPCLDCWEETEGIHAATLAAVYAGLKKQISHLNGIQAKQVQRILPAIIEKLEREYLSGSHFIANLNDKKLDASLLWLAVPFAVFPPDHPYITATVDKLEHLLLERGGLKRYKNDTYYGGGAWLPLTAWLGWYYVKLGDRQKARYYLHWVESKTIDGELPEQIVDKKSPHYRYWFERWGEVAKPLLWSHAMHLILKIEYNRMF